MFLLNCVKNKDVREIWWPFVRALFVCNSQKRAEVSMRKFSSDSSNQHDSSKTTASTEVKLQNLKTGSEDN